MMKKILLIVSVLSVYHGYSQKKEEKPKMENRQNEILRNILQEQLKYGYPEYDDFYISYDYSEKDYNVLLPYFQQVLINSGYHQLIENEFKEKIYTIFKRKLDYTNHSNYIYINFLDKCNRDITYRRNDIIDAFGLFVNKELKIVSDLYAIPEFIDYQKIAGINDYEQNLNKKQNNSLQLQLWKDLPNLSELRHMHQQKLIHRNKYLFNDDRASFAWLRSNDTWFLESLVKTFGYVEDKALLDFVLKENYKDLAELEKILISHSCGGKNRLNTEVFAVVKGWKKKELSDFSFRIQELMYILIKKEEQGKSEINFPELTKILSETAYHMSKTNEDSYYSFFPILNLTEKYREEIEKKNFYNNPDLKRVWEETKTGGRWRPGMEEL